MGGGQTAPCLQPPDAHVYVLVTHSCLMSVHCGNTTKITECLYPHGSCGVSIEAGEKVCYP